MGGFFHSFYQSVLLYLQLPFQPFLNALFRLVGVHRYFIVRSKGNYRSEEEKRDLYRRLVAMLEDAVYIQIALGEMGHRLADSPEILSALERARLKSGATIEVIHGPRVDPDTRRIFSLAWQNKLRLFMTPDYNRHHFILATFADGSVSSLDEGVHNEALWEQDKDGQPKQIYTSRYRIYYLRYRSKRLANKLSNLFELRKATAIEITDQHGYRPQYQHPYKHPFRRTFWFGFKNVPRRWLFQPLENFLDVGFRLIFYPKRGEHLPLVKIPLLQQIDSGEYWYDPTISVRVTSAAVDRVKQSIRKQATSQEEANTLVSYISDRNF